MMNRLTVRIFVSISLLASLTVSSVGRAEQPNSKQQRDETESQRAYGRFFNGSFVEPSVRGGWVEPYRTDFDGFMIDTGLRHSFPMFLGDTRVSYRFDSVFEDGTSPRIQIERHSLGLHVALHPLYLFLIESDWFGYTLASLYLEFGGGVQYGIRDSGDNVDGDFGLAGNVGVGIDLPLADPDRGEAPWLNLLYRYGRSRLHFDGGDEPLPFHSHSVIVGLAWRYNGLLF